MCHGEDLRGSSQQAQNGGALIGGRGTLRTGSPVKTIESYWPYATTIFDYVKRAMPMDTPGSLTDDQVYAVTAFILFKARIIRKDAVIDAKTLPKVSMPNWHGFAVDQSNAAAKNF